MRSTFKILFYANKGKEKDGIVPIMGRITINGTQCQFSCKHSIPLAMWDVKGNCAKGRSKESLQINRDLDNIKAQIIKHYQHLSDREAFVTAEMVRNAYQGFGSPSRRFLKRKKVCRHPSAGLSPAEGARCLDGETSCSYSLLFIRFRLSSRWGCRWRLPSSPSSTRPW